MKACIIVQLPMDDRNLPCPGHTQTYLLKNSFCLAADFKLLATGLEICLTAKLTNLNKGKAPTTMVKVKRGQKYTTCTDQWIVNTTFDVNPSLHSISWRVSRTIFLVPAVIIQKNLEGIQLMRGPASFAKKCSNKNWLKMLWTRSRFWASVWTRKGGQWHPSRNGWSWNFSAFCLYFTLPVLSPS